MLGDYIIQLAVALIGTPIPTDNVKGGDIQMIFDVEEIKVCFEGSYDPREENGKSAEALRKIVSDMYEKQMNVIVCDDL